MYTPIILPAIIPMTDMGIGPRKARPAIRNF